MRATLYAAFSAGVHFKGLELNTRPLLLHIKAPAMNTIYPAVIRNATYQLTSLHLNLSFHPETTHCQTFQNILASVDPSCKLRSLELQLSDCKSRWKRCLTHLNLTNVDEVIFKRFSLNLPAMQQALLRMPSILTRLALGIDSFRPRQEVIDLYEYLLIHCKVKRLSFLGPQGSYVGLVQRWELKDVKGEDQIQKNLEQALEFLRSDAPIRCLF